MKTYFFLFILILSFTEMKAQEDTIHMEKNSNPVTKQEKKRNKEFKSFDSFPITDKNDLKRKPSFDTFNYPSFQTSSPKQFKFPYKRLFIPAVLISYGFIARENKALLKLDHSTTHEIKEHMNRTFSIDDYLQFAPAAAVYGLNICGVKSKHNFRDRTFVMLVSYTLMDLSVGKMKKATERLRPDGGSYSSFPSGHTATAFTGAHILFREYKDESIWIGITGYAAATATGIMRVVNKKHWVSDVVTGAGMGILSAEVGYMLLPLFHRVFGIDLNKNKSKYVITPSIGINHVGLSFTY